MACTNCGNPKKAEAEAPVRWLSVRVWTTEAVRDCSSPDEWALLPDLILGAIGVRSNGTTDYVSGYDWYGWFPFHDGTWRVSGHNGDKSENERQKKRHPSAIFREGILVSDAVMDEVGKAMSEYAGSLRA